MGTLYTIVFCVSFFPRDSVNWQTVSLDCTLHVGVSVNFKNDCRSSSMKYLWLFDIVVMPINLEGLQILYVKAVKLTNTLVDEY